MPSTRRAGCLHAVLPHAIHSLCRQCSARAPNFVVTACHPLAAHPSGRRVAACHPLATPVVCSPRCLSRRRVSSAHRADSVLIPPTFGRRVPSARRAVLQLAGCTPLAAPLFSSPHSICWLRAIGSPRPTCSLCRPAARRVPSARRLIFLHRIQYCAISHIN